MAWPGPVAESSMCGRDKTVGRSDLDPRLRTDFLVLSCCSLAEVVRRMFGVSVNA